jgi:RHS repeat-associated protein
VDRPLAVVEAVNTVAPVTYWVSVDHLNRPVKMTNAAKASVWDAVWQPFGGAHSITGSATLNARLPGQWFQSETLLHYNWHRSYDPTLGRYTLPDPLGFVDGPSVYGYAGGSPLVSVDPFGLMNMTPRPSTPPSDVKQCEDPCTKAIKLLEQVDRLSQKYNLKIPPRRLAEWRQKITDGTITSADLPMTIQDQFPGEFKNKTLSQLRELCNKKR